MVWNFPARVSNSADGRAVTPADLHLCLCPGQGGGGRGQDCALCVVALLEEVAPLGGMVVP